mmetsp:Transcript_15148/g.36122  ORF Transcript_15148/g.36122 Transcript_15148/m.36122 type:complete len:426 (-) Transcript_15148:120-1397(-)
MVWAWGQFLDHDISITHATEEQEDIVTDDPSMGTIPFSRSDYDHSTGTSSANPREQINDITAFIDASNVYGSSAAEVTNLRSFRDGMLRSNTNDRDHELLPFHEDLEMGVAGFEAGDVRANEHIGLTSMHTLFVREHNRLARRIKDKFCEATDERIFQLARKIVGAEMQIITYKEFLPAILGSQHAPSHNQNYDSSETPGIANEFSTAAYRFGHTMLSPNLKLSVRNGPDGQVSLGQAFFSPQLIRDDPEIVEQLLLGFLRQSAQHIDHQLVDDVRNILFGNIGMGLDLASLNIQRGRDHGLPLYNQLREGYGLAALNDFSDVTDDADLASDLEDIYGSPDGMDAWVGCLVENHLPGAQVGELIKTILVDQFTRLRDADPLYYQRDSDLNDQFLQDIINLDDFSLADVIRRNTNANTVGNDVFHI